MAIFGKAATLEAQACNKKYGKVFDYLKNTDLAAVFAGMNVGDKKTVEIDGKNVYAIFQVYNTKIHANAKLEGHKNYADVQYIYEGQEIIGYTDIANIDAEPEYNAEKDIFFCHAKKQLSHVVVNAGEAAILEPQDLHAPCMMIGEQKVAKKIVFKVKM
ncbi:MAG: YhcH/YjgK/YiaL family protein [Bacteroidales bacterium]|nr:YhcH/YjgK/YiaL family protein [Bacteroidales bacterium]